MRDKKAQFGKQIMIFPFVFLLIIIALGISAGIVIFYGTGYDYRDIDSSILVKKLGDCVLDISDFDKLRGDFYETCGLSKKSLEENKYFFRVCRELNGADCATSDGDTKIVESLGSNFQICFLEGAKENKNYPRCSYMTVKLNEETYSIIAGSNQQIRRVST